MGVNQHIPVAAIAGHIRCMSAARKETPTMAKKEQGKGSMSVQEAGRLGGEKVASERGREFYEEIGKKGGEKVASERGHEFLRGDRQEGRREGRLRARSRVLRGDRQEGRREGPRADREGKEGGVRS
jgi:uncharacterized protein